jgi:DNA-binding SARP family transcriptional activator
VRFLVLGPLEVLGEEGPISLRSAKQRLLLAALLVHANAVVSVDRLSEILWGDERPADAAATLQNYVSRLRAVLEPGRASGETGTTLLTRAPGYVLRVDQDQLDANCFERLVAEGLRQVATGELSPAGAALDDALGLWRGRAYAEFADDDFARIEALRMEELRRLAVDERVEANLGLGRHRELIGELEGIVAADPLRERARAQLMLALYRCGREAEALRTYQQYRRYVGDELGIEPSFALRELEEAIILQKSELDWAPSPVSRGGSEPAPAGKAGPAGRAEVLVDDPVVGVPKTRYAKSSDGVHIAYQVAGDGPLDLVLVQGFISHLQLAWEAPEYAHYFRRLARFARVICFDKRGTGMSDPVPAHALPTLEQRMDDVRAVLDAVGSEHAAVVGVSE